MKSIFLLGFIILGSFLVLNQCAECHKKPGEYDENNQKIWSGQPRLIASHKYGKLYQVGNDTTRMKLLHVYGNMYQMGFVHGELLRNQLNQFIYELWDYLEEQFIDIIPKKVPSFLRKGASNFALGAALDLTYQITRPFTNSYYYQQMRGVSDGSGVPFKLLRRVHMIGQLTKGDCSMFGAWGKATSNAQTVQLRSLDWDFDGPFKKYPMAIVYHPSSPKYGNTWMNIGFIGCIGILSGVNQHKMGVSEIGVYFTDETFGKQSRIGNPFAFVLRDVLQWDKNIEESIQRMQNTRRTCNLILGVGDGNKGYFRSFQYSHSVCNVINDTHILPVNDTWHKPIQNVVYFGMDWLCPPFHERLHEMLTNHYGNITTQNTIRYILPALHSGNLQAVIYDLTYQKVYIAYGYQYYDEIGNRIRIEAFKRPYIELNLKNAFSQKNQS